MAVAGLTQPTRFTECPWRKLFDRDPALAGSLTRVVEGTGRTKRTAAVIPLCGRRAAAADPPASLPLIVKANHGCNQFVVVRSLADWRRARRVAHGWLAAPYGQLLDEWHYRAARPFLIIEPFLGTTDDLPIDYKFYVFGGRAELVQIHRGRGRHHRWSQWSRDGQLLSHPDDAGGFNTPRSLPAMFEAAERLANERDFLRVDFYDFDGQATFGEFCLYPGSGLDPFDYDELDLRLGSLWSAQMSNRMALGRMQAAEAAMARPASF